MAIDHFQKHFRNSEEVDWTFYILLDDQPQVTEAAQKYAGVLEHPGLYPPIPAKWLHMTILRVGPTTQYSEDEMLDVTKRLGPKLAGIKPEELILGPWWLWEGGLALHVTPEDQPTAIRNLLIDELEAVVGSDRMPQIDRYVPHVTLVYARTYNQERELHKRLTAHHVEPVSFRATHLSLLKQKQTIPYYSWEKVVDLPIGTP